MSQVIPKTKDVIQAAMKQGEELLDKFASEMVKVAQVEVASMKNSSEDATPYDTGLMAGSIDKSKDDSKPLTVHVFTATAGGKSKDGYGGFVHEGTYKMPPRPFFRWAFDKADKRW